MKKKKTSFPIKPALLFAAAAVLLLGSAVGSTRAALTYYSENYSAQVNTSSIGVSLVENDNVVSNRDYDDNGNWVDSGEGVLLENLLGEEEKLVPGEKYNEALSVRNSGNIDIFARVILTKSWQDENGKDTTLDPDLIELNILEDNGWQIAQVESSKERIVLYYNSAIAPGESSEPLSDTLRINEKIAEKVTKVVDGNKITYVYDYSGYSFHLEAEVDAVQTHNAADAIKSAWGVDVTADETSLSIQ